MYARYILQLRIRLLTRPVQDTCLKVIRQFLRPIHLPLAGEPTQIQQPCILYDPCLTYAL